MTTDADGRDQFASSAILTALSVFHRAPRSETITTCSVRTVD
jgi:hypothetical protein